MPHVARIRGRRSSRTSRASQQPERRAAIDLWVNKPFRVEIEKLSRSVYCPDGVGQWFYERASGSYNTLLAREGATPAKLRALKEAIPTARGVTKTDLSAPAPDVSKTEASPRSTS